MQFSGILYARVNDVENRWQIFVSSKGYYLRGYGLGSISINLIELVRR